MERKLASIRIISELTPIPGADRIVSAKVDGWTCVVPKDQFKVGDKCIYFEIDSVIPIAQWNEILRKDSIDKPLRIKTKKFKKCIAQGLCWDLSILPIGNYEVGDDVTQILGVTKYEPVIPAELAGLIRGSFPSGHISKSDEERIQNIPQIIDYCRETKLKMIGTLKCDGTSATFAMVPKDTPKDYCVCSRNLMLTESETNIYWKMSRKYGIKEILESYDDMYGIQSEIVGPSIQGNRMALKEVEIRVFNVKNISQNRYLDRAEMEAFCQKHNLPIVPVVYSAIFDENTSMQSLMEISNKLKYDGGLPAEGIVWRPEHETTCDILNGRLSFKVVSNEFLLYIGE